MLSKSLNFNERVLVHSEFQIKKNQSTQEICYTRKHFVSEEGGRVNTSFNGTGNVGAKYWEGIK